MRSLSLNPSIIIVLVGVYIPFESYIQYISGSEGMLALFIKLAGELVLYVIFLLALIKGGLGLKIKKSPIDLYLIILVFIGIISIVVNSAPWDSALNNMRALLRYLIVFYLAYHFSFSMKSWHKLTKLMLMILVLNICFSIMQFGLGESYPEFLKVGEKIRVSMDQDVESVRHIKKEEKGASVQGLLESPGVLGIFLIISTGMLLTCKYNNAKRSKFRSIFYKVLLFGVLLVSFLTYAKSSLLLLLLLLCLFFYYYKIKWRSVIKLSMASLFLIVVLIFVMVSTSIDRSNAKVEDVSAAGNLVNLFSVQYWNHFFAAERGWVMTIVLPRIIADVPIVGYSPDPETARMLIANSGEDPLEKLVGYMAFEDVYWVALLGYYGFLGFLVLTLIFIALYRKGEALLKHAHSTKNYEVMAFSSVFMALLVVLILYGMVERVLEVNIFAYYFWLMAGMVLRMEKQVSV